MAAVLLRFHRPKQRRRQRPLGVQGLGAKLQRIAALSPHSLHAFEHMADIVLARLEGQRHASR